LLKFQERWPLLEQPESDFAAQNSQNSVYKLRKSHRCTEPPMQKMPSITRPHWQKQTLLCSWMH